MQINYHVSLFAFQALIHVNSSIFTNDLFSSTDSPSKKHKKHKKHKHKKKRSDGDTEGDISMDMMGEMGDEDVDVVSTGQPSIKLKIKIGGQTIGGSSSSINKTDEL
jgi:hypothetical protein